MLRALTALLLFVPCRAAPECAAAAAPGLTDPAAPPAVPANTICLTMIVKNEAHVLERSLSSLLPHVHAWSIVDTGSTDRTAAVIQRVMASKPGQLHHRPWVDFAHNRAEALELARPLADWSLMFDADDILQGGGFVFDTSPCAAYTITMRRSNIAYRNTRLFNASLPWSYRGVLHEYPHLPAGFDDHSLPQPESVWIDSRAEGDRSVSTTKYLDDALLLERELEKGEALGHDYDRYVFYCAQSWRDAGSPVNASKWYAVRAQGGGFVQERYVSLLNLIRLTSDLAEKLKLAWAAHELVPERLEASYEALHAVRSSDAWSQEAYWLGHASARSFSDDHEGTLFAEPDVYAYTFHDEFAIVAYYAGHFEASLSAARMALAGAPESARPRIRANVAAARRKLARPAHVDG